MLADPLTVTINAIAYDCARIQVQPTQALYRDPAGLISIVTKQNRSATRIRREIRLVQDKVAADPISAVNKALSASWYVVCDTPTFGYTSTELDYLRAGLGSLLTTGSPTNHIKWLAGQM